MLANKSSLSQIDIVASTKLIESRIVDFFVQLGQFHCNCHNVDLIFCIDEEVSPHHFLLVFDDEAEFIPPEEKEEVQDGIKSVKLVA